MKFYLLVIILLPNILFAQECRYNHRIFPGATKTADITYATSPGIPAVYLSEAFTTSQSLKLDVYQPNGDTAQSRALIIFAHPGGFVSGTKASDDMISLCDSFASRGYVTATMDYRMNFNLFSSNSAERAVWRATQDASAAVRYFKSNAAIYKIDTTKIFFWGSSAGSFMALHLAHVDDSERPSSTFAGSFQPDLGCKNCTGVAGVHTSDIAGIISCWGAISDTNWMDNNAVPLIMFHGDADVIVPITEGSPFNLGTLPSVHGSAHIHDHLVNRNVQHEYYVAPGEPHEYWGTTNGTFFTTGPTAYWQDIINKSRDFMLTTLGLPVICNGTLPIINIDCRAKFTDLKSIEISWQVYKIEDAKKYIVEYSTDAVNWQIAGAISSLPQKVSYTFLHKLNSVNAKLYYRVKQVLNNGNFFYSKIDIAINKMVNNELVIYPNPATTSISLYSPGYDYENKLATIYSTQGVIIKQFRYNSNTVIDLSSISNGTYFIKLYGIEKVFRLVVMK